jgi:hypothetical protein
MVRNRAASPIHIQASAAASNGPVAMMIATFETLVRCKAGMNVTIATVDMHATNQPLLPIPVKLRSPARPCVNIKMSPMTPPPNRPRQNRMVQESNGSSRVKSGAVLQAMAATTTSAMPKRCWEEVPAIRQSSW